MLPGRLSIWFWAQCLSAAHFSSFSVPGMRPLSGASLCSRFTASRRWGQAWPPSPGGGEFVPASHWDGCLSLPGWEAPTAATSPALPQNTFPRLPCSQPRPRVGTPPSSRLSESWGVDVPKPSPAPKIGAKSGDGRGGGGGALTSQAPADGLPTGERSKRFSV